MRAAHFLAVFAVACDPAVPGAPAQPQASDGSSSPQTPPRVVREVAEQLVRDPQMAPVADGSASADVAPTDEKDAPVDLSNIRAVGKLAIDSDDCVGARKAFLALPETERVDKRGRPMRLECRGRAGWGVLMEDPDGGFEEDYFFPRSEFERVWE